MLNIERDSLIAYWPLWEVSGTTADNYEGTVARDATYSSDVAGWPVGSGVGDGYTAPFFDGSNDYVNIYTSSLNTALSGTEGTLLVWFKVYAASVWTDTKAAKAVHIYDDSNNDIYIEKAGGANRLTFRYRAAGTSSAADITSQSFTDFRPLVISWSAAGDAMKMYINGAQVGTTQTGLGAWSGTGLSSTETNIGAYDASTERFHGWLAHVAIWTKALSDSQILSLATI